MTLSRYYDKIGVWQGLQTLVLSFVGANAKKKGILIANIVFGVLTFNLLNIVGAILGIIGLSKEKKEEIKEEPEVIEEKE